MGSGVQVAGRPLSLGRGHPSLRREGFAVALRLVVQHSATSLPLSRLVLWCASTQRRVLAPASPVCSGSRASRSVSSCASSTCTRTALPECRG